MMRSRCYPLLDIYLRGGKVLRTFLFILRGILFLVTIRKQLTLERATQLVATWQLGCQTRPPFSNVPKCVLSPLTTSLVFRLFFSLPTARRVRDSFVDWKNLFRRRRRERERKFIGRFIIFRQKLKVGWIDRRSGDRQLPYSLWGISVKRLERRKIRGACRRVVKWRPRGCLRVRLERVNRKLKPFKCKGEETVFTFLSLFVTI